MATTLAPITGRFSLAAIAAQFRAWRAQQAEAARRDRIYRRTLAALSAMTDADLADIGIPRFMIAEIAADHAARA